MPPIFHDSRSHRNTNALISLLAALALFGCSSDGLGGDTNTRTGKWWQCPPVKGAGLEHGKKCTTDADCMYGHCFVGGFLTGYNDAIKFCTKNNNCTGGDSNVTASCSSDGAFAPAFEKTASGGNPKRTSPEPYKVCGRTCTSDAECQAWNAEMPDCIKNSTDYVSLGKGVCGLNPLK